MALSLLKNLHADGQISYIDFQNQPKKGTDKGHHEGKKKSCH